MKRCRMCTTLLPESKLIPILQSSNNYDTSLFHKIEKCLRLTITEGDSLPRESCLECEQKVSSFYQFYLQVKENQQLLENYIKLEVENDACKVNSEVKKSDLGKEIWVIFDDEDYECIEKECIDIPEIKTENQNHDNKFLLSRQLRKQFKCNSCGKFFTTQRYLNKHIKQKHLTYERLLEINNTNKNCFKCDICGKSFNENYRFIRHTRIHSKRQCDQCGKILSSLNQLLKHKHIHTGERPYVCDTCGKSFTQLFNMERHKRIHTGEKPFKCDICGKWFNKSDNLKQHQLIHSDEKAFQCDICGKTFRTRAQLMHKHRRLHSEIKTYECNTCGKMFKLNIYLQKHLKQAHSNIS